MNLLRKMSYMEIEAILCKKTSLQIMSHKLSDTSQFGECNFYDVEKRVPCYKKATIREDANSRMLCGKHYEKYKKILQTQNKRDLRHAWKYRKEPTHYQPKFFYDVRKLKDKTKQRYKFVKESDWCHYDFTEGFSFRVDFIAN